MSNFTYRTFNPQTDNINDLVDLFLSEYDADINIANKDFLAWQYFGNPYGNAIIMCAFDNNFLIGVHIINPVIICSEGKNYKMGVSINAISHKNYRGKNLFVILSEKCYEEAVKQGFDYIIAFPSEFSGSYNGFLKKLNFADLGKIDQYFKIVQPIKLSLKKIKLIAQKSAQITISTKATNNYSIQIYNPSTDYEKLDSFFEQYLQTKATTTQRSAKYYQWRYLNNPCNNYYITTLYQNNQIEAVMVISHSLKNANNINIIDFCFIDALNGDLLMQYLIQNICKTYGINIVKCYLNPNNIEKQLLKKFFFLDKNKLLKNAAKNKFIIRSLNKSPVSLDYNNWYICMGDADIN